MGPASDSREQFADAVEKRLRDLGHTKTWLAEQCGVTTAAVSYWLHKAPPARARVYEIEDMLEFTNGELSRILGYLRDDVAEDDRCTVERAVMSDPALTERAKGAVLDLYRTLAEPFGD